MRSLSMFSLGEIPAQNLSPTPDFLSAGLIGEAYGNLLFNTRIH